MTEDQKGHEWQLENLRGAINLGGQTVKSLLLVNGGAAAGLLTFYGNALTQEGAATFNRWSLVASLSFFAAGLFLGIICSLFAYLSQLSSANTQEGEIGLRITAVILGIFSALAFMLGLIFGVLSLPR